MERLREEARATAALLPALPWNVTAMRRGTYLLFLTVNDGAFGAYVVHPFGDVDCGASAVSRDDPAAVAVSFVAESADRSSAAQQLDANVRELTWGLSAAGAGPARVLTHGGGRGSWYEGQALPGALLRVDDMW